MNTMASLLRLTRLKDGNRHCATRDMPSQRGPGRQIFMETPAILYLHASTKVVEECRPVGIAIGASENIQELNVK